MMEIHVRNRRKWLICYVLFVQYFNEKSIKKMFYYFRFFRQLERLTGDWFYHEIAKKFKRCGSAKVVRELYRREKELGKFNYI